MKIVYSFPYISNDRYDLKYYLTASVFVNYIGISSEFWFRK